MKNIVIFTGAGISKESGIPTYRDTDGLWTEYNPEIYASAYGWRTHKDKLNDFYNMLRGMLKDYQPNDAHKFLGELEKDFQVNIITQNVDNLHERGGSTNVTHLHGELTKIRNDQDVFYTKMGDDSQWVDIGYGELNLKEKPDCRPAMVFFGEEVPKINEAYTIVNNCDIFITIGTSLQVYPAANLLQQLGENVLKIVVDPHADDIDIDTEVIKINKNATESINELKKLIYEKD